jgi:putative mRNA 3-end processing factor
MALITFTQKGLYCSQADLYIDPWRPVKYAVITNGHGDHARPGHVNYLCTPATLPILRLRLGEEIKAETLQYGEKKKINGVTISFHPAGHIIGSAQVRLEYQKEIWVVSGDYKIRKDPFAEAFEPVKCDHFVTESTFGLPVYRWPDEEEISRQVNSWWKQNRDAGKVSVIGAYALGKAQRILAMLDTDIGPVFTHGAVENVNATFRTNGIRLPKTIQVETDQPKDIYKGGIVIATPSGMGSTWMRRFAPYSTAMASGWMMLRGTRRRRSVDRGFTLSDHADWQGLNSAIKETGAENIYVTHGYSGIFSSWLKEQGLNAIEVDTQFEGESIDQQ